jgi:hypothetical protein
MNNFNQSLNSEQFTIHSPDSTPACTVCGRQDETVRSVVYPFVISVVVITFRRALSGTLCAKHRLQKQSLATLLTASLGWIGIPFGFIYTPGALFKLARGGDQPAGINADNLLSIADHKLRQNDPEGALKCYEESLKFRQDETALSRIKQIRENSPAAREGTKTSGLKTYLGMIFKAFLIGIVIGILDQIFTHLMAPLLNYSENLLVVFFSWVPFLVLVALGAILLVQFIEDSLSKVGVPKKGRFATLAILAGFLCVYGIMHGSAIADYFAYYIYGGAYESLSVEIILGILTFLVGGLSWLYYSFEILYTADIIYLILMGAILIFYLISARYAAVNTYKWREILLRNRMQID